MSPILSAMTTDFSQELAGVHAEIAALRERITHDDDPWVKVMLAASHLDRYELTDDPDDPADLFSTIRYAEAAVQDGSFIWSTVLSSIAGAHYHLAMRWERDASLTEAVDLLSNQIAVAPEWGQSEMLAAIRLGEVAWVRLLRQPDRTTDLDDALDALVRLREMDLPADAAEHSGKVLGYLSAAWSSEQGADHPRWLEVTDRAIRLLDASRTTTEDADDRALMAALTSELHWRRYRTHPAHSADADLTAAIEDTRTALAADPTDVDGCRRLAFALQDRYDGTQDPGDRDDAIRAFETAVRLVDEPDREGIEFHGFLGEVLLARAEAIDCRVDLDAAIEHLTRCRDALPVGDEFRTRNAISLSEAYFLRGGGELGPNETAEIIAALKELLEHWPDPENDDGREAMALQLGIGLLKGALSTYVWRSEQEEGLALLRDLYETTTDPLVRVGVKAMIGGALSMRFMSAMFASRLGPSEVRREDLDEAIRLLEEALADPDLDAGLAEWLPPQTGMLLFIRASPTHAWDLNSRIDLALEPDWMGLPEPARVDLDRAVGYFTGARRMEGAEHLALLARVVRLGGNGRPMTDAELDEAIDCVEQMNAVPLAEMFGVLSPPAMLGPMLAERAERTGNAADAHRAMTLLREALAGMHPGQLTRPAVLDLFARLLTNPRFVREEDRPAAMADAVDALTDLVGAAEAGTERWWQALDRLAGTVLESVRFGPDALRSERIVGVLRTALDTDPAASPMWPGALAVALADRWQSTGGAADLEEAIGLALLGPHDADEPRVRLRVLLGTGLTLLRLGALADRPHLVDLGLGKFMATRSLADDPAVEELLGSQLHSDLRWVQDACEALRDADGPVDQELIAGLLTARMSGDPQRVRSSLAPMVAGARTAAPATSTEAERLISRALALVGPAVTSPDLELLDEAADLLERGLLGDLADESARPAYLVVLGRVHLDRHRLTADPESVHRAIAALERARAAGDSPPSGQSAAGLMALARTYRLRAGDGDAGRAVRTARAAMRDWTRAILLTDDAAARLTLARDANERMAEVVGWALDAGDATSAIVLLEAGRGLLLHAATATASVAAILARTGHGELAESWSSDSVDSAVRSRALAALSSTMAGHHVLSTPEPDTISQAIWGQGADALVYLVPASAGSPGRALVMRDQHPIEHLELPELGAGTPGIGRFLTAGEAGSPEWRAALDQLAEWAWTAAIGPLLERARAWGVRREPRVVLVPTGALSAVPWHAARSGDRYACAELVISYAASGRSMVDAVRRPLPTGTSAAFVVDPTGSAGWAAIGARETRTAFHPDADHLGMGRRAGGPAGTRAEVLALLTEGTRSPLQLSTHAAAAELPTESYFLLADGRLTVAEILARAGSRPADAAGGTVICDACATDFTAAYHDEALTLSTAFLAAGWSTAIGTRWPVDDQTTAVLMFVLHDRMHAGLRPADAVRATQLWALDPHRQPLAGTPATLARRTQDPGLADPYCWAAFTHHGR